jgi:hypothetical protein
MSSLFRETNFNEDISGWILTDVSNVKDNDKYIQFLTNNYDIKYNEISYIWYWKSVNYFL